MSNVIELTQSKDETISTTPNLDVPFNDMKLLKLFEVLIERPNKESIIILREKQLKLIHEIIEESNTIYEVFDAIYKHNSTIFSDVKLILEDLMSDAIRLRSFINLAI